MASVETRTGVLMTGVTITPDYNATPAGSAAVGSVRDESLAAVNQRIPLGIVSGVVTADDNTNILKKAIEITAKLGDVPNLGTLAVSQAYSEGLIDDAVFLFLAAPGTAIPTNAKESFKASDWTALNVAIPAIGIVTALTRSTVVTLPTSEFKIPARRRCQLAVEYRIRRSGTAAQTAYSASSSVVQFAIDGSRVSATAEESGSYKQTVAGMCFQLNDAAAAAIASGTFDYRYVVYLSSENKTDDTVVP